MHLLEAIHIEPTRACNLNCLYCYNNAFTYTNNKEKEVSFSTWMNVIDQAYDLGCRDYGLSGGEFFTYPYWREMLRHIEQKGVKRIAVFSNAMLLDESTISELSKIRPLLEFRISLDGFSNADIIRHGSNHSQIIDNIRMLKSYGFPVVINTLLTDTSMNDLSPLYDTLLELGVQKWLIDIPFRNGRAASLFKSATPSQSAIDAVCSIIKRYIIERPRFALEVQNLFKSQMLNGSFYAFEPSDGTCSYIKSGITVRSNGDTGICPTLSISCGNIQESSLKEILLSDVRKELLNIPVSAIEKCNGCKYMKICGGGCRADALNENGSIYMYDPVACVLIEKMEKSILPLFPDNLRKHIMNLIED